MARANTKEPTGHDAPRTPRPDRPDPRPARLMMGAGALAAVSIMGAGLVRFPPAAADEAPRTAVAAQAPKVDRVERAVKYVRLKPGQRAPNGAKVIEEAEPTPRVIVRRIVTSAPSQPVRTVARSRQSGG